MRIRDFFPNIVLFLAVGFLSSNSQGQTELHPYYKDTQAVAGNVVLGDDLKKVLDLNGADEYKFLATDVVFVILSDYGSKGGQPVAVIRIGDLKGKKFPLPFAVGPKDSMMGDPSQFKGPFSIKVKMSHHGDAMTQIGDFTGYFSPKGGVKKGAKGLTVKLDKIAIYSQAPIMSP